MADKPSIFISWSGDQSKAVALAMREWLAELFDSVEPWMSAEDIEKGERWNQAVSGKLSEVNFAIVCLTVENLKSPWVLFETGALSKAEQSRICTYLFEIEPSDVSGPLSFFQHTVASEQDTRKLVHQINESMGLGLDKQKLDKRFERYWPDLSSKLQGIPEPKKKAPKAVDPMEKLLRMTTEILELMREQSRWSSTREAPLWSPPGQRQQAEGLRWASAIAAAAKEGRTAASLPPVPGTRQAKLNDGRIEASPGKPSTSPKK
jgi:hypothetical protein